MKFLADEDLDNNILRALSRETIDIDMVRVQDVGLMSTPDSSILSWAATEGRIVLSHDVRTMVAAAKSLMNRGAPMVGLIIINRATPIRRVRDDLELICTCMAHEEWISQIGYIP